MLSFRSSLRLLCLGIGLLSCGVSRAKEPVDFNRDIRPILADKCYMCHGPDAKELQGGLRLDLEEVATKPAESGAVAIVPGKAEKSELVLRIFSTDDAEQMPPSDSHKKLDAREKGLLKRWIDEGAEYKDHWAFIPPERTELPKVKNAEWVKNAIDHYVLARLESQGLKPSREAGKETLIRRVSLDLRGFPPTLKEIDQFLADDSARAYEHMVDRMLASPHFGEKMARIWMDLARYGDTNGFHYDSTRQVWMWRDWVINAYNTNMPFDRFTVEQLAGDLLPNATVDQKIASGFNRNTRYNEEGGADPEEWRVEYAKDRTRTLGQVWLGLTIGCAECHTHKYDPITQKEFYQIYAFFNSLDEPGAQGHRQKYPPFIEVPTKEQEQAFVRLEKEIETLNQSIREELAKIEYQEPKNLANEPTSEPVDVVWIDDAAPEGANLQGNGNPAWQWIQASEGPVHSGDRATKRTGQGLNQHFFTGAKTPLEIQAGDRLFAWVWLDPKNPPKTVQLQFNDGVWEHRATWGQPKGYGRGKGPQNFQAGNLPKLGEWVRLEVAAKDVGLKPGAKLNGWAFTQFDGTVHYDTAGVTHITPDVRHLKSLALWEKKAAKDNSVPAAVRNTIKVRKEKRSAAQQKTIRDYYLENIYGETRAIFKRLHSQKKKAEADLKKTQESVPFQLVSVEMKEPRPAHLLIRGEFNKPGEKVTRDVPEFLPGFPKDAPKNRLGLAKWVIDPQNPLTARVTVNRYWAQLFGRGLVETIGDFGHLGRFPSHPKLLDWLAVEFVESGWDTKHLIKQMVMSETYRQSSVNDHRHDAVDPKNHLLWRAPRFRLPAEEIRDSALKIAALLSPQVGGPPVFPYQPKDYYKGKKGGWEWKLSQEQNRFRRGMYTFWRRTTPYPTFVIFDAPDRTECIVARARTNTPLQALATMNDPQFVEAARGFGRSLLEQSAAHTRERLTLAFRRTVARQPTDAELTVLQTLLKDQQSHYQSHPEQAKALMGDSVDDQENVAEFAAWTAIGNTLLNLDETINRE